MAPSQTANSTADATLPGLGGLRLESALQLLSQSGHVLPADAQGSPAWLQQLIDALCDLSSRDPLTGLANRRSFEAALGREIDRVARSGEPALLLMIDIDHFKRVNDTHGHAVGDLVIKAVAEALGDTVRPMDLPARIGGEEFAVILPNCAPTSGRAVAERVRERIEKQAIQVGFTQEIGVTVSIGGAFAPQWVRSTPSVWMERADLQLYRAKSEGRNRTCLEPTPVSLVTAEEKGLLFANSQFGEPYGEVS
jgi:diguanylate cyclase (GGDEF)-like protein